MNLERLPKKTRDHLVGSYIDLDGMPYLEFDFWDVNGHTLRDQFRRAGATLRLFEVLCENGRPKIICARYVDREEPE